MNKEQLNRLSLLTLVKLYLALSNIDYADDEWPIVEGYRADVISVGEARLGRDVFWDVVALQRTK